MLDFNANLFTFGMSTLPDNSIMGFEEAFGAQGFWDRLPHLAPPALFLWGREDRLVPAGFARHVESCLPEATSVILEDCGHVPQFEHPEITMRLVREFLETGRVVTEPGTTRGFPESS